MPNAKLNTELIELINDGKRYDHNTLLLTDAIIKIIDRERKAAIGKCIKDLKEGIDFTFQAYEEHVDAIGTRETAGEKDDTADNTDSRS